MKRRLIIIAGVVLLIGGFVFFMPKNTDSAPKNEYATIIVKNKELSSGPSAIHVRQGDTVILKITADQPNEFHLHGYDEKIDLEAGTTATLSFTARLTGKFEYELEQSQLVLGYLQVDPR